MTRRRRARSLLLAALSHAGGDVKKRRENERSDPCDLRDWWRWRCVAAAAACNVFYSRHAAPPLPPLFRGGAAGGPTASSFQSNAAPWLRKRMILKTNGACLITFLVFECAS